MEVMAMLLQRSYGWFFGWSGKMMVVVMGEFGNEPQMIANTSCAWTPLAT
jgi:hypothetical protein